MKRINYYALATGIILSIITAYCIILKVEFLMSSEVATGKVINLKSGAHRPRIKFDAKGGQNYEISASTWQSLEPGDSVQIRYSPDDPRMSASVNTILDQWAYILFLSALTAGFIDGGLRGEPLRKGLW